MRAVMTTAKCVSCVSTVGVEIMLATKQVGCVSADA